MARKCVITIMIIVTVLITSMFNLQPFQKNMNEFILDEKNPEYNSDISSSIGDYNKDEINMKKTVTNLVNGKSRSNGLLEQNARGSSWVDSFEDEIKISEKNDLIIANGNVKLATNSFLITTTSDFDAGSKDNVVTKTDEYEITDGQIQLKSPCYSKDKDLVLFLPMNEGSGSTVFDETSNNNDGTINEAKWANGKFGKALDFDGINDNIIIVDASSLYLQNGFSISIWLKDGGSSGQPGLFEKKAATLNKGEWRLLGDVSGSSWYTSCVVYDDSESSGIGRQDTDVDIFDGNWHHIVGTWDSGTACSSVKLYIDGSQADDQDAKSGNFYGMDDTSINILIADSYVSGVSNFKGIIDEAKIFKKTLSLTEIQSIYNSGNRYKSTGTWESVLQTIPSNYRLLNFTVNHLDLSGTEKITEIRWKIDGITKAIYSSDIISGSSTTVTNADLSTGSFNDINKNFTIEIDMAGSGSATPIITEIKGTIIANSGSLTSTSIDIPYNYNWNVLNITKVDPLENYIDVTIIDEITGNPITGYTDLVGSSINITSIIPTIYPSIKLRANITYDETSSGPILHNWEVTYNLDYPTKTAEIPSNLTFNEDTDVDNLIDLRYYFHDRWTEDDNLIFEIVYESNKSNIDATIDGFFMDFTTPNLNWSGQELFKVRCIDEGDLWVLSNEFIVTVNPINDAPAWLSIQPIHILEDNTSTQTILLDNYVLDSDDSIGELSYEITINNNSKNISVEIIDRYIYVEPLVNNYVGSAKIVVKVDDGLLFANLTIIIIIDPVNDRPTVKLLSPKSEAIITKSKISLSWEKGIDVENSSLTYDIYLGRNQIDVSNRNKSVKIVNEHKDTIYTLSESLSDGTYYWTVIPDDGTENGICLSGIWSFTINTTIEKPVVNLLSPMNNSIVNTAIVNLTWDPHYSNIEILKYNVYLKSSQDQQFDRIAEGIEEAKYSVSGLLDGITYHWYVEPYADDIIGSCKSGIWIFEVKIGTVIKYNITLTTDIAQITILPGHSEIINIIITNNGNSIDHIDFTIRVLGLSNDDVSLENQNSGVRLEPNESINLGLAITIAKDEEVGEYKINIKATSRQGGSDVFDSKSITVIVPEEESKIEEQNMGLIFIFAIIIIIIIIIMVVFVSRRRKKVKVEAEYIPAVKEVPKAVETFVAKPSAVVQPTISMEKVPAPESPAQLPPPISSPSVQTPMQPQVQQPAEPEPEPEPAPVTPADVLGVKMDAAAYEPPKPEPEPQPLSEREELQKDIDLEGADTSAYTLEGGPKEVEKEAVEHEAEDKVVEEVDSETAAKDLEKAGVFKATEETAVVHEGDKSVWRPDARGKAAVSKEILEQIEKLAEMKEKGIITEEEFLKKKVELLK